jgi:RNA polymerase sigma-70 factor (ECF subfamily)
MVSALRFERSPEGEARYTADDTDTLDLEADPERLTTELTDRYWERLRLFAARRTRDVALAEDVAQETIQRTLEALRAGRVRSRKALPAFLFQTARHICMHRSRSAGRESRALEAFAEDGSEPSTGRDVLAELITSERVDQVRSALRSLPSSEEDLLRACFGDAEDTEAIARRLRTTPGALRVRKHRALRRLAGILGYGRGNAGAEEGT